MTHDPLCPHDGGAYHELGENSCVCDFIDKVRADEAPKAVTRWIERGAGSDDWMKVGQVRDYAEELEVKVKADTIDRIVGHVQRGYRCSCGAEVNNFRLHLLAVTEGRP